MREKREKSERKRMSDVAAPAELGWLPPPPPLSGRGRPSAALPLLTFLVARLNSWRAPAAALERRSG